MMIFFFHFDESGCYKILIWVKNMVQVLTLATSLEVVGY